MVNLRAQGALDVLADTPALVRMLRHGALRSLELRFNHGDAPFLDLAGAAGLSTALRENSMLTTLMLSSLPEPAAPMDGFCQCNGGAP